MNRTRTFASLLGLCLALLTVPSRASSFGFFPAVRPSGVQGSTVVWQYQMIPIDGVEHSIKFQAPFPAQIEIYSMRTGRLVATITTHSDGTFKVPLRPGQYRLVPKTKYVGLNVDPKPGDLEPLVPRYQAAPVIIRILPHAYTTVRIVYQLNQAV